MTIVVKVGGAAGNSTDSVLADLASRPEFVLVHGGSAEVDRLGASLGLPSEYYTSPSGVVSRRSDPARLGVVVLALAGKVQTELVAGLLRNGRPAVGLSGVDGRLLLARRKEGVRAVVDGRVIHLTDDRSGTIVSVNDRLLRMLLAAGLAPVVGPPAVTDAGEIVNVDADRAAAAVAAAVGAEALVLLTNVPGLLRDPEDSATLVPHVAVSEVDRALPLAQGRMRKKLLAAKEAVTRGVGRVVIGSSNLPQPVEEALRGRGTVVGP